LDNTSDNIVANLKITRGLDYYTGAVFETFLVGYEHYGSISSGGRYENLTSTLPNAGKVKFPGVGMSIGVTRLLSILLSNDLCELPKSSPVEVLVVVDQEGDRNISNQLAKDLRNHNISAITALRAQKYGKQIDFAAKHGIRYVLFPQNSENNEPQMRDIVSGEQTSLEIWYNTIYGK
jgi:histidyl-tRNA synthetase